MTKLHRQFVSVIATGALLLNVAAPVAASSTITISGNGVDSNNDVSLHQNTDTTVTQTNTATVVNNVSSGATSGGNSASYNTGGDISVDTGAASSGVTVVNDLNTNQAQVNCCGAEGVDVTVSDNGANTKNDVDVNTSRFPKEISADNNLVVNQTNEANVANNVDSNASSGKNNASYNTNGSTSISTGPADSTVGVKTTANTNGAVIGGGSYDGSGVSAVISGNGADSHNDIDLSLKHDTQLFQTNSAEVANNVDSHAKSGYNWAKDNTGGTVDVSTGMASADSTILNTLNFNWADVNCCATYDVTAKIVDNGADSHNDLGLWLSNDRSVVQTNDAYVLNAVDALASSGMNRAYKNTGGDVSIGTGDAYTTTDIYNTLNFNMANLDCCVFGIDAKIGGNGVDSNNDIWAKLNNTRGDFQTNGALLGNDVGGYGAKTGMNSVGYSTGNSYGDPSIMTGDAASATTISNTVNTNEDGSATFDLPGFNYQVQLSMNWAMLFAMLGWN